MGNQSDTPDAAIARIALRQHGVVTLRQLEVAGLSKRAAVGRVQRGRLHRIHRGVYAVGHRGLSLHGHFTAAVLACGEGAVLSHGSAAVLWDLLRPLDGPIHVSVPTTAGLKSQRGVHVHRCPSLRPEEPSSSPSYLPNEGGRGGRRLTTTRHRIPVTTIQRTIDDLASAKPPFPPRLLRRAKRQAEMRGIRLVGADPRRSRSDLEDAFFELWRRYDLPLPETNVKIGRWEVDFFWRAQRLVVEADFFGYHQGSVAFQDDHARELDLRGEGFTVLRYTDQQLDNEPARIAADVTAALAR
ncbi:MAG TPA: type IV toxin-antitoxin system AbiEi family antitoxin domain-containing protein [Solirubrobacterales bacterium]|nr:type IV toxin-antitoxin system AbiEi family antitoxin domain-containing protein [Solirubrobacterales bacterium]